jgi:hypothetical protein
MRYEDRYAAKSLESIRISDITTDSSITNDRSVLGILSLVLRSRSNHLCVEPKRGYARTQLDARLVHLMRQYMLPCYEAGCTTMFILMRSSGSRVGTEVPILAR